MRIAHVITRMIVGGAQENTLLCCQQLRRHYGDDVLLITGPSPGPEGDLLELVGAGGTPVALVSSLCRPISPVRDLLAGLAIRRILREFRPDVVHTHSAKGGFLGRLAAAALREPVVVHTVHGAPYHAHQGGGRRALFRWCERLAASKCDAMVSVADAMTDLLVEGRVAPRERFVTIYSGMDVAPLLAADQRRETTRQALGYRPEHVVVGKIARLFHLKGHQYLIQAAADAVRRRPELRFLLVGDGVLRDRLERRIREEGLADFFQLIGLAPPPRIPSLIGAMDMVVHTSLREGLARALPQALIAARPVISYDVHGAREVVVPGETGYLLPPQSVAPLADAIVELASDPSLRRRLGRTGRERLADAFRYERTTEQLRRLYQRLIDRRLSSGRTAPATLSQNPQFD